MMRYNDYSIRSSNAESYRNRNVPWYGDEGGARYEPVKRMPVLGSWMKGLQKKLLKTRDDSYLCAAGSGASEASGDKKWESPDEVQLAGGSGTGGTAGGSMTSRKRLFSGSTSRTPPSDGVGGALPGNRSEQVRQA
jgi:hypothetical protein